MFTLKNLARKGLIVSGSTQCSLATKYKAGLKPSIFISANIRWACLSQSYVFVFWLALTVDRSEWVWDNFCMMGWLLDNNDE